MRSPERGLGILQAQLHVLEPGLDEAAQPIGVEPDAGGDQIDVEPGLGGMTDELDKIAANQRLAAGKCTCKTPSAAASANTRRQVAVSSSALARDSSIGFEQ